MSTPDLTLTLAAQNHIKDVLEKKGSGYFRISVSSGGCNGLQYSFDFIKEIDSGDQSFTLNGVPMAIDPLSLPFLEGITLDFKKEMMGSAFHISNPNASSSCGCGSSFSI